MGTPYFLCKKFGKKSYQVRLVFLGALLGFGGGWFLPPGVVAHLVESEARRGWDCAGCRGSASFWVWGVLSKINYKLSIFNLWLIPSSKINISLENTGCFKSKKKEKSSKIRKKKTSGPIPKKALNFLSQDFCFQNKIGKKVWTSILS